MPKNLVVVVLLALVAVVYFVCNNVGMKPKQRAEQLDQAGKCILCEKPAETRTRGLCRMHHGRFISSLKKLHPDKHSAFESLLIEQGKLLPSRRGQKLSTEQDEFAQALLQFQAQGGDVDKAVADHMTAIAKTVKAIGAKEAEAKAQKRHSGRGTKKAKS